MRTVFKDYKQAHIAAVNTARLIGREVGILKTKEFSSTVFQVMHLPKPENRYGIELRCEVVKPSDPLTYSEDRRINYENESGI